jgi:hypothetical protein
LLHIASYIAFKKIPAHLRHTTQTLPKEKEKTADLKMN